MFLYVSVCRRNHLNQPLGHKCKGFFYLSPTSCWELEFDLRLIKPCGKSHVAHSFSMAQASQHTKNKQEKHSVGDTLC